MTWMAMVFCQYHFVFAAGNYNCDSSMKSGGRYCVGADMSPAFDTPDLAFHALRGDKYTGISVSACANGEERAYLIYEKGGKYHYGSESFFIDKNTRGHSAPINLNHPKVKEKIAMGYKPIASAHPHPFSVFSTHMYYSKEDAQTAKSLSLDSYLSVCPMPGSNNSKDYVMDHISGKVYEIDSNGKRSRVPSENPFCENEFCLVDGLYEGEVQYKAMKKGAHSTMNIARPSRKTFANTGNTDLHSLNLDDPNGDWCQCKPTGCKETTIMGVPVVLYQCPNCKKVNRQYARLALQREKEWTAKGMQTMWTGDRSEAVKAAGSK